jgi:hypothetical protein
MAFLAPVLAQAGAPREPRDTRRSPSSSTTTHVDVLIDVPPLPAPDPGTFHPPYSPPTFVPGPAVLLSEHPGTIELTVDPVDAEVYLDGQASGIGQALAAWPATLSMIAGDHELYFVAPGYRDYLLRVVVVPGHTTPVDVHMAKVAAGEAELRAEPEPGPAAPVQRRDHPGDLRLDVRPMGAAIYIDGEFWGPAGAAALTVPGLEPGRHDVEVVKPGYRAYRGQVVVPEGYASVGLTITLRAEPHDDPVPGP